MLAGIVATIVPAISDTKVPIETILLTKLSSLNSAVKVLPLNEPVMVYATFMLPVGEELKHISFGVALVTVIVCDCAQTAKKEKNTNKANLIRVNEFRSKEKIKFATLVFGRRKLGSIK